MFVHGGGGPYDFSLDGDRLILAFPLGWPIRDALKIDRLAIRLYTLMDTPSNFGYRYEGKCGRVEDHGVQDDTEVRINRQSPQLGSRATSISTGCCKTCGLFIGHLAKCQEDVKKFLQY